jgi:hypothetical protein
VTGLLDFEAAHLADPLFNPPGKLVGRLSGPGLARSGLASVVSGCAHRPGLGESVHVLQVLHMVEQLASATSHPTSPA